MRWVTHPGEDYIAAQVPIGAGAPQPGSARPFRARPQAGAAPPAPRREFLRPGTSDRAEAGTDRCHWAYVTPACGQVRVYRGMSSTVRR